MKKLGRNAKFLLLILAVFMTVFMLSGIVLSTSALSENGQENEASFKTAKLYSFLLKSNFDFYKK